MRGPVLGAGLSWRRVMKFVKIINFRKGLTQSLLLFAAVASFSCSSIGIRPWERDRLASEEMQENVTPLTRAFDDHIYFSKESSSGGAGFAGGGCGCN